VRPENGRAEKEGHRVEDRQCDPEPAEGVLQGRGVERVDAFGGREVVETAGEEAAAEVAAGRLGPGAEREPVGQIRAF
jgi:hypothetical protein